MGKENVKEPVPHDLPVVQTYVPLTSLLGSPYRNHETICAGGIPEEIQEDDGDMNDDCDITVEDIERVRKILTPSIYTLPNLEPIVQPYMPLGLVCHKAKVFKKEFADPVNDLKELLKTYDFETFIQKLLHQVVTSRGWNSRSPRLILCSIMVAETTSYGVTIKVEVCGVMLGQNLATGKHFKTGLVGYHIDDDDGIICDDGCCLRKQT
ncbi:hypothetical protein Tco_0685836 [Tanacetum coccineum]